MKRNKNQADKKLADWLRALKPQTEGSDVRPPCPEARILRDFAEGRLSAEREDAIACHLLACKECAREILAWDAVEERDETVMLAMQSRRTPRLAAVPERLGAWAAAWRERTAAIFAPRPQLAWALGAAAAAVLVFALVLTFLPETQPGGFTCELISTLGTVRDPHPVFSPQEELRLELKLAAPRYVYVVGIAKDAVTPLYPDDDTGEAATLSGDVVLPGKESVWNGFAPGTYAFLVGVSERSLEKTETEELRKRLESGADPAEAVRGILDQFVVKHFEVR